VKQTLDRWLLLLDGALALLFVSGYAAAYVDPRVCWWLAVPATGLPLLGVLLLPALAAALLRGRRGLAASYGALLLLAGVRFAPALPRTTAAATTEAGGTPLTVMTLNAPVSVLNASPVPRDTQRTALRALLRRTAPDVIGLQEVASLGVESDGTARLPWHIDPLPAMGYAARRALYDGYDMMQPVFTRLPVLSQQKVSLDPARRRSAGSTASGTATPGYVVRTRFRWRGRAAAHYNVHLRSFARPAPPPGTSWAHPARWRRLIAALGRAYRRRAHQADRLRRLIEAETRPVIVSGDFNSTPHHWSYRRIAEGLTDAFAAGGRGRGATWPSAFPLVRIDHVLAGPAWRVTSARVPSLRLADHRPLLARLRWTTE
jgi:endonuclease/exonuclease/phosphatase family metal-dependent hydrolase